MAAALFLGVQELNLIYASALKLHHKHNAELQHQRGGGHAVAGHATSHIIKSTFQHMESMW